MSFKHGRTHTHVSPCLRLRVYSDNPVVRLVGRGTDQLNSTLESTSTISFSAATSSKAGNF